MPDVFVGLGSNISPQEHLEWALRRLEERFGPLTRSSVYRSAPHGFDGPDFLNMVVRFQTESAVSVVEGVLSDLETECGRGADERTGSRTLDLDLLLFGERVDAAWRLPREDILRYSFVCVPLVEIAPTLKHPVTGVAMTEVRRRALEDEAPLTRLGTLDAA